MTLNGLLPIGSVVLLKESTKRLMITGVAQYHIDEDGNRKLYDYVGVVFPEGFLSAEENFLFNADQIEQLFFVGLQDTESMSFAEKADEALARLREED